MSYQKSRQSAVASSPKVRTAPSRSGQNGHAAAATSRRNGAVPSRRKASHGRVQLLPSHHSEAERHALLRSRATRAADQLQVSYGEGEVRLGLSSRGVELLEGLWQVSVSVDGHQVRLGRTWETACWNADEDADYLEIQLSAERDVRIDRQVLLARNGHVAVLADAILAPGAKEIEYRSRLSIPASLKFISEKATRAGRLKDGGTVARCYPLALQADRAIAGAGELTEVSGGFELRQRQAGAALYAPLVVDFDPGRRQAPADWRSLTVTENGQKLAIHEAAAYRLRVGREQWLVYHSLRNRGEARAFLGHHTWNETVIGAFARDGELNPLILIEQADVEAGKAAPSPSSNGSPRRP